MKAGTKLHNAYYGRNFSGHALSTYDTGFAVCQLLRMSLIINVLQMRHRLAYDLPSPAAALATKSINLKARQIFGAPQLR
jgi:hypothetical protein